MADPNAHAPTELRDRLAALRAARGAPGVLGFVDTALPGARLFWSDRPVPRAPLSYAPGIALIASGRKIGFFEDRRIAYGAGRYLAVGLPLHFECETVASPGAPLLGLFLTLDPEALRALARDLADHDAAPLPPRTGLGIEPLPLGAPMQEAALRLAGQLLRPAEAAALAPATLKEIFFHALRDRHGRVLLSQTRHARPEARIARLLRDLDAAPERFGGVDSLAEAAGMSASSLHRHFKAATGLSPLQYQKRRRLMQAKSLLVYDRLGVAEAARAVGYASPAQFSRDFRAYFGTPPSRADRHPYPV